MKKVFCLMFLFHSLYAVEAKLEESSLEIFRSGNKELISVFVADNNGMNEFGAQAYGEACVRGKENIVFGGVVQVQKDLSEEDRRLAPFTLSLSQLRVSVQSAAEKNSKKYFSVLRTGRVGAAGHWYLFMADLQKGFGERHSYYIFNPSSMGNDLGRLDSMRRDMAIVSQLLGQEVRCHMVGIQDQSMDCGGAVLRLMKEFCESFIVGEPHPLESRYLTHI